MTTLPERFAAAAEAMINAPFRLYGRHPRTGVDCVGLVLAALDQAGRTPFELPTYGLRNMSFERFLPFVCRNGFTPASGEVARGDLLLAQIDATQAHLLIAADADVVVHAHAGVRRVVRQGGSRQFELAAHWRLPSPE